MAWCFLCTAYPPPRHLCGCRLQILHINKLATAAGLVAVGGAYVGLVVAFVVWPSFWCSVSIDVLVRARCVDVVFSPAPVLFSYQYVPRWIGLNWGSPSNGICENSDSKQAAFYADFLQQVTSLPISSPPHPPPPYHQLAYCHTSKGHWLHRCIAMPMMRGCVVVPYE